MQLQLSVDRGITLAPRLFRKLMVLTWLLFVWAATTEGGGAAQFRRTALITPVGEQEHEQETRSITQS
jgi:hypothetical protein